MRIALISKEFKNKDIDNNLWQIEDSAIKLSAKADIICFGEAFLHGFNSLSWNYEQDKHIAISSDSTQINTIKEIAKSNQIAIAFGYFELAIDKIYCSYMVVDCYGEIIYNYRRVSRGWKNSKKTDKHYVEGSHFSSFNYMNKEIVVALCGDLWYKKNIDEVNKLKKDFVLWPLHIDYSLSRWVFEENEYVKQSKKIQAPLLMVNNISEKSFGGAYYFNKGKILNYLPLGQSGSLIVRLK